MESTHWFDDLIEAELALALMIYWQLAPPYLVVDALDLAHASLSQLTPLSHAHALSLQQGRHHTCGLILGLVFTV